MTAACRTLGKVTSVTIFNSGGGEGRQGRCGARRGTSATSMLAGVGLSGQGSAHGISDGVSGLEVGGGRLMRVGCDAAMVAEK